MRGDDTPAPYIGWMARLLHEHTHKMAKIKVAEWGTPKKIFKKRASIVLNWFTVFVVERQEAKYCFL